MFLSCITMYGFSPNILCLFIRIIENPPKSLDKITDTRVCFKIFLSLSMTINSRNFIRPLSSAFEGIMGKIHPLMRILPLLLFFLMSCQHLPLSQEVENIPLVLVDKSSYPKFSDDMDGNSLLHGIAKSRSYYKNLPKDKNVFIRKRFFFRGTHW